MRAAVFLRRPAVFSGKAGIKDAIHQVVIVFRFGFKKINMGTIKSGKLEGIPIHYSLEIPVVTGFGEKGTGQFIAVLVKFSYGPGGIFTLSAHESCFPPAGDIISCRSW